MATTICVFEGDGAAPEAVRPTVALLRELDLPLDLVQPPVGVNADRTERRHLLAAARDEIENADAVLFGASGGPHGPILRYLRREYGGGTFANVRPVTYYPGARSPLVDPAGIDYVLIRENLQGLYVGVEGKTGDLRDAIAGTGVDPEDQLAPMDPGRFAVRAHGEAGIRRFAAFAADYAATLGSRDSAVRLTCVSKSNVLPGTDGLFDELVAAAADERGVPHEHLHVDDAAQQLVLDPAQFNVVVTPNLAGDVLSELGAGTVGGLGFAPSGCYGEDVAYFEPVHGTAPDIAGQGVINPTATVLSAAMMLDYLAFDSAAAALRDAIAAVYADGQSLTPDQGGSASTDEFVDAVAASL